MVSSFFLAYCKQYIGCIYIERNHILKVYSRLHTRSVLFCSTKKHALKTKKSCIWATLNLSQPDSRTDTNLRGGYVIKIKNKNYKKMRAVAWYFCVERLRDFIKRKNERKKEKKYIFWERGWVNFFLKGCVNI